MSRLKYDLARYSLGEFERVLPLVPNTALLFRFGADHGLAPVWAHSDGCLFHLYAAFDAFACAVAHRYRLPKPERASFAAIADNGTLERQSPALCLAIQSIAVASKFVSLSEFRNIAAHRSVIGRGVRTTQSDPSEKSEVRVYLKGFFGDGIEVIEVLRDLTRWAIGPLEFLWEGAEEWRTGREWSVKGTQADHRTPGI